MRHIIRNSPGLRAVMITFCLVLQSKAGDWSGPAPEELPQVSVRYADAARNDLIVEGAEYRIVLKRKPVQITAIEVYGKNVLTKAIVPGFVDDKGVRYIPQQSGIPRWKTYQKQSYKPAKSAAARINVWNAGPYYWDAHVLDIPLVPEVAEATPKDPKVVRGQIVFHTFPDRVNIEFCVDPEKTGVAPKTASWDMSFSRANHSMLNNRSLLKLQGISILGLSGQTYDASSGRMTVPLTATAASNDLPRCWWVLRPSGNPKTDMELFVNELSPLAPSNFKIKQGRYLGYDSASGMYTIEAVTPGTGFNAAYDTPNRRTEIPTSITNDGKERQIMIKSVSHSGMLPATVLADEHGFMLPTPVLSCKNFGGEREEPNDSAFGNAFFPIKLKPQEKKRFQILHLYQNWGDHMLKQVSSVRFFHIYWHLSTGVSETTCYTIPSMRLNNVWVRIPDFRPYSGAFWKGQPQHGCKSWPGLLQYQTAEGEVRLIYDKTVFESITPNLALFTMYFRTSDGAARASARILEIPQGDEMRTFVRVRYEFDKAVTIKGDARNAFRWLNINDKMQPKHLVYLDAQNKPVSEPLQAGAQQALGKPLGSEFPFVGTHGMPGNQGTTYYSSLALIRSFKAKLGGTDRDKVHFSTKYGKRGGNYWFSVDDKELTLKAGDFLEADVLLTPHAEGTEPLVVPTRERIYYGTEGPTAETRTGKALEDFPATVMAENEVATALLKGGTDATTFTAKGYDHWATPLLWVNGSWQNQQAHGGDGYQVSTDTDGKYRFTFVIKQRQGHPRHVMVTRASCTTGISETTDRNGYLVLTTTAAKGEFTLKAPSIFGPGVNTIIKDEPVIAFKGIAKSVFQVPLSVSTEKDKMTVTVKAYSEAAITVETSDAATLHFSALTPNTAYTLSIDGKKQTLWTSYNGRSLEVAVPKGKHTVTLSPFRG